MGTSWATGAWADGVWADGTWADQGEAPTSTTGYAAWQSAVMASSWLLLLGGLLR